MSRYRHRNKVSGKAAELAIAESSTSTVARCNLADLDEAQCCKIGIRCSAITVSTGITAKLWHGVRQRDSATDAKDMFDTGLSVTLTAIDTDYFITHVTDPTDATPLVLLPYLELRVTTGSGDSITVSEVHFFGKAT